MKDAVFRDKIRYHIGSFPYIVKNKKENIKLNNENELLKHDLEKYKNGFKSMYE